MIDIVPKVKTPEPKKGVIETSKNSMQLDAVKNFLINFIVPLIALGVSGLLIVSIVIPNYKKLPELKSEIAQKEQTKATLEDKLKILNDLVDYSDVVEEDSEMINTVLVSEANVPQLLDQIHQIVNEAGLTISRLSYSYAEKEEDTSYDSVDVSLGASGSFSQVVTFMKTIENAARVLGVSNFRYSLSDSEEGFEELTGSFAIDSPYLFVQSSAVTDEPIKLDITSQSFNDFMAKIKGLKYYSFFENIEPVVQQALEQGSQPQEDQPLEEEEPTTPDQAQLEDIVGEEIAQ